MLLNKKVVLVTGASKGIGAATIKKCLKEGADVVANYRTEPREISTLISQYPGKITAVKGDVTSNRDISYLMQVIKTKYGRLDGIVNNAGIITRTYDWKKIDIEDWNSNINTNLIGAWNVIRFGENLMNLGGSIVNVSSVYGLFPESEELTYSISKAGLIALTHALSKKLAPEIRINVVAPGNTLTSMVPSKESIRLIEEKTLLKRSARPEEVADTILFLLSERSSYMTDCVIPVDGGYHTI